MKKKNRSLSLALASASLLGGGAMTVVTAPMAHADTVTHVRGVPQVLNYVRYCESRNNYKIVNSIGAAGAYQITRATWWDFGDHRWATANAAPSNVQDAAAVKIYNKTGLGKWTASRSCWAPMYNAYLRDLSLDNKLRSRVSSQDDQGDPGFVEAGYIEY